MTGSPGLKHIGDGFSRIAVAFLAIAFVGCISELVLMATAIGESAPKVVWVIVVIARTGIILCVPYGTIALALKWTPRAMQWFRTH